MGTIDIDGPFGLGVSGSSIVYASSSLTTGGDIAVLAVSEDFIGAANVAGEISDEFTVGGGIFALDSSGTQIVNADIDIAGRINSNSSVSTSALLASSGLPNVSLIGTFDCGNAQNLVLEGDIFTGGLTMTAAMQPGDMLNLKRSLPAGTSISLPTNGLAGQIIINGANGTGTWDGDVNIGTVTLTPNYAQSAQSLGNGAVGLVPFDLHATDSLPPDALPVDFEDRPDPSKGIQIRHYGPISITGDPEDAIEFTADYGTGVSTLDKSWYTVSVDPTDDTVLVVTPVGSLWNGYTYRIMTDRDDPPHSIECDLGLVTNPLVADYTYEFCVGTALASDINVDHAVDVFDFADLADAFGMTGPFIPGDLNADGAVDVFDFAILADEFGATGLGSCSTSTESLSATAGSSAFAETLEALGYESIDDFCESLDAMTPAEQAAELDALLEALGD